MARNTPPKIEGDPVDIAHVVRLSWEMYRQGYYRALAVAAGAVLVMLIAIGLAWAGWSRPRGVVYFAIGPSGRVVRMRPISDPITNESTVNNWAVNATVDTYTMSFGRLHLNRDLARAQRHFLPAAWQRWISVFGPTILSSVQSQHLLVSAVPQAAPTVLAEGEITGGPLRGRYSWKLSIPLAITYMSAQGQVHQNVNVDIVVVRANPITFSSGLAIADMTVTSAP
ncbi:MAG: DotI/IcmL/TraM family protein [Acidiferrobacteraceae bacterium]